MIKKKNARLAKWVIKEATALKSLLTKKQAKRLKKAEYICPDQRDECLYGTIVADDSSNSEATELMGKVTPRWFRGIEKACKPSKARREGWCVNYTCIEVALCRMPQVDVKNLVLFLTGEKDDLILHPSTWKFQKYGSTFQLKGE